jgi:hypothetical protein
MIGAQPEPIDVQKQVEFSIAGDGKVLTHGRSGIWILGHQAFNVDVRGVRSLTLSLRTMNSKRNTLFWGNGAITTKDGRKIFLKDLPVKTVNVLPTAKDGQDYYGGDIKIAGVRMDHAIPAEPKAATQDSRIEIDLSQIEAERLTVVLGGDFPLGDESPRRKTLAIRSKGTEARFLTVIEPFESASVIERVEASDEDHLRVWLKDGREQEITIQQLDSDQHQPIVSLKTINGNALSYTESTK